MPSNNRFDTRTPIILYVAIIFITIVMEALTRVDVAFLKGYSPEDLGGAAFFCALAIGSCFSACYIEWKSHAELKIWALLFACLLFWLLWALIANAFNVLPENLNSGFFESISFNNIVTNLYPVPPCLLIFLFAKRWREDFMKI